MIQAVTVGAFLIACVLSFLRPGWALALVLSMYTAEQALQASSGVFVRFTWLANLCIAAVAGLSALGCLQRQEQPFVGYANRVWLVLMGLYVWSSVSLLWTPSFESALGFTTWGLPYLILFMLVSPLLIDGLDDLKGFLGAYVVWGTVLALVILANPAFEIRDGRLTISIAASLRSNPLATGEHGGLLMVICVLLRPESRPTLWAVIRVIGFLAGLVLALRSGSRGQLLFAGMASIVLLPFVQRSRNVFAFLGTVIVVSILLFGALLIADQVLDFEGLKRWDASTLLTGSAVRSSNAMDILRAFARDPVAWLIGLGFNAFPFYSPAVTEGYSHTLFVDVLTELGLPVFLVFLWALWITFGSLRSVAKAAPTESGRVSMLVLAALLLYEVLLVNKQGNLWLAFPFFLLAVLAQRIADRERAFGGLVEDDDSDVGEEGDDAPPDDLERTRARLNG
ncbi:MAG: O-antigen ligase family protein [Phycisphaerae bacterium]|nr:O-antigen ligase family protein [Phycisphaerae bacterium]